MTLYKLLIIFTINPAIYVTISLQYDDGFQAGEVA